MIGPYSLRIGLLNYDKWYPVKNMGSLRLFICSFQFDPSLHVDMMWPKRGAFGGMFRQLLEQAAPLPRKLYEFKFFCMQKCFANFTLYHPMIKAGVAVQGPIVCFT